MRFARLRDACRSENQVTRFASDSLIFFRPARCSVGSPPEAHGTKLIVNCCSAFSHRMPRRGEPCVRPPWRVYDEFNGQLSCRAHGVGTLILIVNG
ncbi:hypothetical protein [Tannerella forsythia]|uniref:hypothetical protein n=1 Tax=Tannerella forsythia TaxID=28112 RepID=UPI0015CF188D|nr:hypothetical protein [Tannerella forsythia]